MNIKIILLCLFSTTWIFSGFIPIVPLGLIISLVFLCIKKKLKPYYKYVIVSSLVGLIGTGIYIVHIEKTDELKFGINFGIRYLKVLFNNNSNEQNVNSSNNVLVLHTKNTNNNLYKDLITESKQFLNNFNKRNYNYFLNKYSADSLDAQKRSRKFLKDMFEQVGVVKNVKFFGYNKTDKIIKIVYSLSSVNSKISFTSAVFTFVEQNGKYKFNNFYFFEKKNYLLKD